MRNATVGGWEKRGGRWGEAPSLGLTVSLRLLGRLHFAHEHDLPLGLQSYPRRKGVK